MLARPGVPKLDGPSGRRRGSSNGYVTSDIPKLPNSASVEHGSALTSRSSAPLLEVLAVAADQPFASPCSSSRPSQPIKDEDLFLPLSSLGEMLPERVQSYLSLLADSTTKPGGMQRHLIQLMARGAKVAHILADPMDGLTDVIADAGRDLLLTRLGLRGRASKSEQPSPSGAGTAGGLESIPASPAAQDEARELPSREQLGLQGIHTLMVGGRLGSFLHSPSVSRRGSVDDSCLPSVDAPLSGVHAKALSVLLSMMVSGATSGAVGAITRGDMAYAMAPFGAGAGTEAVMSQLPRNTEFVRCEGAAGLGALGSTLKTLSAPALHEVPSAARGASSSDMAGAGGMAASTALRLLRADSRKSFDIGSGPSLGNLLSSVLDTVNESMDDHGNVSNKHGHTARDRAATGSGAGAGSKTFGAA